VGGFCCAPRHCREDTVPLSGRSARYLMPVKRPTGTTLLLAFLYLDHTSRIHLGTRHKKDPGLRRLTCTIGVQLALAQLLRPRGCAMIHTRVASNNICPCTSTCSQCCQDTIIDWHIVRTMFPTNLRFALPTMYTSKTRGEAT
jgi:hypothetical protein